MKEITVYGDQYGKWYEVKSSDGYYKTFRNYQDATEYYKEPKNAGILAWVAM